MDTCLTMIYTTLKYYFKKQERNKCLVVLIKIQ